MIIVKIGGSVLSNKRKEFSFRGDVVKRIAYEISRFYPEEKFIVVHGGGSFGHPLARKFRIREGLKGYGSRHGFIVTHLAMLELASKVTKCFLENTLPAFPISSSSIFVTKEGKIVASSLLTVKEALSKDFIPLLFGDVSFDTSKGIEIVSGDEIILHLAKEFRPEKVIFLMDVDGIYDRFPGGKLIERLTSKEIESMSLSGSSGIDVTGGIKKKLEVARELVRYTNEVWFVNGLVKDRLSMAIVGNGIGTVVQS
ncbi:isopentenyl phosphate kinase [Pyrococcus abyssi]|uniref:Isopentenyl phosphate kinase n=1 Tax=Pyrococcus abyssi (strain GE5 / Orsay) TaxID=272844 RepID=Q9V186_PYRAB|nr:isopentenyl phosphate kinase [Pyrococcus abyssi]CAB49464.1 Predicted archaeal kinase [Pyrococcus abyssi GE5]CCE69931.1 TPA: acetylglutamate kinase, putative [Pyrococcus abyssi GE5]